MKPERLCCFGGSFDPPHNAHFIIADAIREILALNKILFIPALNPPHKYALGRVTPIEHRLAMLKLCIKGHPHFDISEIEIQRGGVSYTIDTIRQIKQIYGMTRDNLYFLIGSDSLISFKTWKEWQAILDEAQIVVARRPRFEREDVAPDLLEKVIFLDLPRIEISSSEIRRRFYEGRMTDFYIPEAVSRYIAEHGLYQHPGRTQ